ncbi:MAG: hypothetical protein NZ898_03865 [Myxococcota bacterium]|nr:hypothetical protein [Myxococcota bacterium]MDW8362942.1 hypothetical protein [Myxococcales bacterium]
MRSSVVASGVLLALSSGCFAVADLDRFRIEDPCRGGRTDVARDLELQLIGLAEHADERVEIRVVDDNRAVVGRIVLDGLRYDAMLEQASYLVRRIVPPGPAYELRLYVDLDASESFESREPGWNVTEPCPSGRVRFERPPSTADIHDPPTTDIGQDFRFRGRSFEPHVGNNQPFVLAVTDVMAGRTVGFYATPRLARPNFDVRIPRIVVPSKPYDVDFYVDVDGDGAYDRHPTDHTWRIGGAAARTDGLVVDFEHNTAFQDVCDTFSRDCG